MLKIFKKTIALMLSLVFIFTLVPSNVIAEVTEESVDLESLLQEAKPSVEVAEAGEEQKAKKPRKKPVAKKEVKAEEQTEAKTDAE